MRKIKSILIWSILLLPFMNIFADVLPVNSFKGRLVIVQELKINNDTVRLGVSSEGQLLRYDGTKYTNWTPDFDSLYSVDSVKYLRGRIQIYQGGNVDSTEILTVDTTQVLNLQQFVENHSINQELDPVYSIDSSFIKSSLRDIISDTANWNIEDDPIYKSDSSFLKSNIRDWNSSVAKLITAEDTTYWNSKLDIELDPIYSNDSTFLNSGVRNWNSSLAKTIDATDTTYWGRAETDPTVSAWAKAATKPTYTYSEVGAQPAGSYLTSEVDGSTTNEIQDLSRTGNTLSLSSDGTTVDLSDLVNPDLSGYRQKSDHDSLSALDEKSYNSLTDKPASLPASDVYPWAKAATKPTYTKSEVGLSNVDNTSDANKPISTATQTALNNLVPFFGADRDVNLGANSISTDTVKIDGVPLLLNTFKQGNLGGAGNIFYSTGASSQPASGSLAQLGIAPAVEGGYLPRSGGSMLNTNLVENLFANFANSIYDTPFQPADLNRINRLGTFTARPVVLSGSSNMFPTINNANAVITLDLYDGSSDYFAQLGFNLNGDIYTRVSTNPWNKIYHSGNSNRSTVDWNAGQFISHAPTGTPPLVVASSTKVDSLNAGLFDGKKASDFQLNSDTLTFDATLSDLADSSAAIRALANTKAVVSGTDNYIMKKTGANTLGNSNLRQNSTTGGIGIGIEPNRTLHLALNGQPTFALSDTRGGADQQEMGFLYDAGFALARPGMVYQKLGNDGSFRQNLFTFFQNGTINFDGIAYPDSNTVVFGSKKIGAGTNNPAAQIHSQSTGTQARLGYDANKYTDLSTGSTGNLTITPSGGEVIVAGDIIADTIKARADIITPKLKTGTTTNNTTFEADGTMVMNGDATVFEDLFFPFESGETAGTGYPVFVADSSYYTFVVDTTGASKCIKYFIIQLPHSWKEGSTIYPHVHYKHETAIGTPSFKMKYKWYETGQSTDFGWSWYNMTTTTGTTNNTMQMAYNASGINGTGKTVSSILICQVYLSGTPTNVKAYQFDIHIEKDALGSRTQTSK